MGHITCSLTMLSVVSLWYLYSFFQNVNLNLCFYIFHEIFIGQWNKNPSDKICQTHTQSSQQACPT